MTQALSILVVMIGGYLLGSVPFGLLLTRAAGLGDIRTIGSGNIGATNVLRTGRKGLALATLGMDGAKGALAVLLVRALGGPEELALLAGAAAILGHLFPVWLRFKGGKGVATTLGTLIAADWMIGISACVIWVVTAFLFRYSSLAALVAVAGAPMIAMARGAFDLALLAGFSCALVWVRHRENIARLVKGTEPKIGLRGPKA
jgi:glycerol-3-phosphate acyltransferase PlsY